MEGGGGGGGDKAVAMQVWVSPMFRKTAEPLWGGWGLKIWKKMLENKVNTLEKLGIFSPVFCTFSFTPTQ